MRQRIVIGRLFDGEALTLISQPVRSPLCFFRVCENRRHSRGLGWRAGASSRHILEFRLWIGGFAVPVSARHFPISVSAYPIRYVTETVLRSRFRACTAAKVERWIDQSAAKRAEGEAGLRSRV